MSEQENEKRPFHNIPEPKFRAPGGEMVAGELVEQGLTPEGSPYRAWKPRPVEQGEAIEARTFATMNASEITYAIDEGKITNPEAIRVYAQKELTETQATWRGILERHEAGNEPWLQERASLAIAYAEQEYKPLIAGDDTVLAEYSSRQAASRISLAQAVERGEVVNTSITPDRLYRAASHRLRMAARLAERKAQQVSRKTPTPSR